MYSGQQKVVALLGPTNTGKTHYAIERMLGFGNGLMGLPLRLLAREVYDKICKISGTTKVALITGEEKIVPKLATFYICTVEAMSIDQDFDFIAIDEVQLCADPERGHIFTEKILNLRGKKETLFLGSDTIKFRLSSLFEDITFINRSRLSDLTYAGAKKISRLPSRSAIIGFSGESVYSIAEFVRRQKGGAAVVLGALSPRTRNAQVQLYENGEVDYLVATDAIGMGLNLHTKHVAFSAIRKFDGRNYRELFPNEIGQIAGRAGRNQSNGTFGVTGELPNLDPKLVEVVENHSYAPVKKLFWRNSNLDFNSVADLIISLEKNPTNSNLLKAREADDLASLKSLWALKDVSDKVVHPSNVKLLWEICLVPDFRKISSADHCALLKEIFKFLSNSCRISDDWLHSEISKINKLDGDIDTLSKRLSFIRTWTYVANRSNWVNDPDYWQGYTRQIEDNLSDTLHERLKQRFIDRRTSVLIKGLRQREKLVAVIKKDDSIFIDDQFVGKLNGFLFELDKNLLPDQKKTFLAAASSALSDKFKTISEKFYRESDHEIEISDKGNFIWQDKIIAKCHKGKEILKPEIIPLVSDFATIEVREKIKRRLTHFLDRKIESVFEPLFNVQGDDSVTGISKGLIFMLIESLGVIPRSVVMNEVKLITQEERSKLRKHGLRFGQFTIFFPTLIKPAPTKLRLILWGKFLGMDDIPPVPSPGLVSVEMDGSEPKGYFPRAGLRAVGNRAIRIDILERVVDLIREENTDDGFEASSEMLSLTGMSHDQFADLMSGLHYKVEKSQREKKKIGIEKDIAQEGALTQDNFELETFYTFYFRKRDGKDVVKRSLGEAKIKKPKSRKSNKKNHAIKDKENRRSFTKNKVAKKIDPNSPFAALMALKENT